MIIPVILCGGSGTRLWPLSRKAYPKQLLPLVGEATMLQMTLSRVTDIPSVEAPLLLCNDAHRFMVAEQTRTLRIIPEAMILEPVGRNTAPAAAVAAWRAVEKNPDAILLVLPADHLIQKPEAFREAIEKGLPIAQEGKLITFGIKPNHPETGYGYIKSGLKLIPGVFTVDEFVEKPDFDRAQYYVEAGDYFWNSGMFMFKASQYLDELTRFSPEIAAQSKKALDNAVSDLDFIRLDEEAFEACPNDSVDYAVMEKTDKSAVIPMDAGWSDLGSWASLYEVGNKDEKNNSAIGDVLIHDSEGCYLRSNSRLLAAVGLQNVIVVETSDAVLVSAKDKVQEVKHIVNALKERGSQEAFFHKKIYRPWGSFETIDVADRFQVKRITVKPGATLSLQKHHHRSEHWVVVKGTAEVTRGDETILLTENESVYIPLGTIHRLKNPGKLDLDIIEVQSGGYLGEDDIVRVEDFYGREGRND